MNTKVLVTGTSGFIGRHLAELLNRKGYQVFGLDRSTASARSYLFHFDQCDLLEAEKLHAIVQRISPVTILHLAARTDLDEKQSIEGYAANIQGVENLVAAVRATPSVQRMIVTSTKMVCPDDYLPKHDTDYAPYTLYGRSKMMTEQIVRKHDGVGVVWCFVRPSTVWGPGMSAHYQSFLRMVQRGRYFHVGNRPTRKNFGYVGNVVHQFLKIMEAPAEQIQRRVFYLGDYEPIDVRDWAGAFQREFQAPPIRTLPEPVARLASRVGDLINAVGLKKFPFNSVRLKNVLTEHQFDVSKTEQLCGPPPYSMEAGVKETVQWLRQIHPDWFPAESASAERTIYGAKS